MLKRNAPSQVAARKKARASRSTQQAKARSTTNYSYNRIARARPIVDLGVGLPDKVKIIHRHVNSATVTTNESAGTTDFIQWQANGIYDIQGNNQAYYFDQLSALYKTYTVIGARITLKINGGSDFAYCVLARQRDVGTSGYTYDRVAEQVTANSGIAVGGSPALTLTANYSAKDVYGGSVISDGAISGTDIANPSDGQAFIFGYKSVATSLVLPYQVLVEYITIWENRKNVDESFVT